MKKQVKKITALFLIVMLLLSMFSVNAANIEQEPVSNNSEVQNKINSIASVYPTGSYFTKSGNVCYSNAEEDCKLSNIPSRGGLPSGATVANITRDAWSCCAFARYVFYCTFGLAPENCGTVNSSNAQVGDYINFGTHYAIYLGQDSNYWYVYDSNYTSPPTNIVKYNRALRKSSFSYVTIYHASNYDSVNGSNNNYVDIGTDFYASITHIASWNHLTVESNDNVDICSDTNFDNQYWKFYRQYDGSYKIVSAKNDKCLDVAGGSSQDGANIGVYSSNDTDAQRWYIYKCKNGYQFKPKCSNCVMEMNAWNFYQGVNLVCGTKDNSDAEIFAINFRDFNDIADTTLNYSQNNGVVTFSWITAKGASKCNIKIYNGNSATGEDAPINLWNVQNNQTSINLGEGTFTAVLQTYNAIHDYHLCKPITISTYVRNFVPVKTLYNFGHKYELFDTPVSWETAKKVCENKGGHLAVITSQSEQNTINELISSGKLTYYNIGATNINNINEWQWVTNEKMIYTNWAVGEPNNVGNIERYLSVFNTENYLGQWNDTTNSSTSGISNGFICEYENILGDINSDGKISVNDVTELQMYISQSKDFSDEQKLLADYNQNGIIDVLDVTDIQQLIANS